MFNYCPDCGEKGTLTAKTQTLYVCSNCKYEFFNNAKAAVAVVFIRDGQMLCAVRKTASDPGLGMYDLPGGFVDFGETAQEAAVREVAEELSVTLHPEQLELIDTYHNFYTDIISTVDVVFLVRSWEGDFMINGEVASLEWKPLSFVHDPQFFQKYYTDLDTRLQQKLG